MRKAGISDYESFAREALSFIKQKPISFEVFSDDLEQMKKQAMKIASWGDNVNVKIPITNTSGKSTGPVIEYLVSNEVKINVTAIMTTQQVREVARVLDPNIQSYVSVFAGRIADTGRDPLPIMSESLDILKDLKSSELIWASPREFFNVFQANEIGCHIITATTEILKKIDLVGYDLESYSLDTVKMFYSDSKMSNFNISDT
jgi:transaldolase